MSLDLIHILQPELATAESILLVGGGEPCLYPHLWEAIDFIRSFNEHSFITLTTNGTIPFSDDDIKRMSQYRVGVVFSIDSVRPEINELTRIGCDTKAVLQNLQRVLNLRYKQHFSFPMVVVLSILTPAMLVSIPETVQYCIDAGVDLYHLETVNLLWGGSREDKIELDETGIERIKIIFAEIQEIARQNHYPIEGRLSYSYMHNKLLASTVQGGMCVDPWLFGVVLSDGTLAVCPNNSDFIIGKIEGSFMDLWNGEKAQSIRKSLLEKAPDLCQRCREVQEHNTWFKCT